MIRLTAIALFACILALSGVFAASSLPAAPPKLPDELAQVIDNASELSLYSLQPWGGPDLLEWDFHGHHQLGHIDLEGRAAKRVVGALNEAIVAGQANTYSMCLISPRHAIRVRSGSDTYDVLICYQCGQLELFKNNQPLPFIGTIGRDPQTLNALLTAAGIPLADAPDALRQSYAKEDRLALERASNGDQHAEEVIGRSLITGRGGQKDEEQGIGWLARAAGKSIDDPELKVNLGILMGHSRDFEPDPPKIMSLFKEAADQGNAEGQYRLAEIYDRGEGVGKDQARAEELYRKAATQGNPKAEYELGIHSALPQFSKQDYPEAMGWFRKAAEKGHPEAMYWIAILYLNGWGVKKDFVEAYYWSLLAAEYQSIYGYHGPSPSPTEMASVRERVERWTNSHVACPDNCR